MPDPSFAQLRSQVFTLYDQGAWQEALALLDQRPTMIDEPAQAATVVFWRACFLSLLGRAEEALHELKAGLDRGYWWAEHRLRNDSDLQNIQGRPALDAVIAECEHRRQAAEQQVTLARLVEGPPSGARQPYPPILALHGYDGNAAGTLPFWAPLAAQGWLVAALQSTQLSGMSGFHWSDEDRARRDVQQHLRDLSALYALNLERLVLGGFSNGGRAALTLALTGAIPAAQVISIGASLRDETLAAIDWLSVNPSDLPRVLFLAGERDKPVLPRIAQQAVIFERSGVDVTIQIVPDLGHDIPPDLAARLSSWLMA